MTHIEQLQEQIARVRAESDATFNAESDPRERGRIRQDADSAVRAIQVEIGRAQQGSAANLHHGNDDERDTSRWEASKQFRLAESAEQMRQLTSNK